MKTKKKNTIPYFLSSIITISFLILILAAKFVFGWTAPASNPPTGNGALYSSGGNIGIGGTPSYKLSVLNGSIGGNFGLTPNYAGWGAYGTGDGGAAIYNDNGTFKKLMIVGNNSAGGSTRVVGVWDNLIVNGNIDATNHTINNVATPVNSSDVATKAYVDAATSAGGYQFHETFNPITATTPSQTIANVSGPGILYSIEGSGGGYSGSCYAQITLDGQVLEGGFLATGNSLFYGVYRGGYYWNFAMGLSNYPPTVPPAQILFFKNSLLVQAYCSGATGPWIKVTYGN